MLRLAVLSEVSGSAFGPATVMVPLSALVLELSTANTIVSTGAESPAGSATARVQVRVEVPVHDQLVPVAEVTVVPAGTGKVTTMGPALFEGPELVTVTVAVALVPGVAVAGEDTATERLDERATVAVVVAVSPLPSGSASPVLAVVDTERLPVRLELTPRTRVMAELVAPTPRPADDVQVRVLDATVQVQPVPEADTKDVLAGMAEVRLMALVVEEGPALVIANV